MKKKGRGRPVEAGSEKIIKMLRKGIPSLRIERMGFSRSTIRYNKYKLFNPEQYRKTLDKIKAYAK